MMQSTWWISCVCALTWMELLWTQSTWWIPCVCAFIWMDLVCMQSTYDLTHAYRAHKIVCALCGAKSAQEGLLGLYVDAEHIWSNARVYKIVCALGGAKSAQDQRHGVWQRAAREVSLKLRKFLCTRHELSLPLQEGSTRDGRTQLRTKSGGFLVL